eukprot:6031375-Pyramimonas_sp.AAC.1
MHGSFWPGSSEEAKIYPCRRASLVCPFLGPPRGALAAAAGFASKSGSQHTPGGVRGGAVYVPFGFPRRGSSVDPR